MRWAVDPYGPDSPDFVVGGDFYRIWTAALAHCQKRFEGKSHLMSTEPSGGIGSFSPDNFPVFDTFCDNAYFIADSNHGYKMIGVGTLVAKELLGEPQALLEPFRWSRYAEGRPAPGEQFPLPLELTAAGGRRNTMVHDRCCYRWRGHVRVR